MASSAWCATTSTAAAPPSATTTRSSGYSAQYVRGFNANEVRSDPRSNEPRKGIARTSSLDRISSAQRSRLAGRHRAKERRAAGEHRCAPSARAFRMSTPRRTPPSSSTAMRLPTALAIAGNASRSRRRHRVGVRRGWTRPHRRSRRPLRARRRPRSTPLRSSFPATRCAALDVFPVESGIHLAADCRDDVGA